MIQQAKPVSQGPSSGNFQVLGLELPTFCNLLSNHIWKQSYNRMTVFGVTGHRFSKANDSFLSSHMECIFFQYNKCFATDAHSLRDGCYSLVLPALLASVTVLFAGYPSEDSLYFSGPPFSPFDRFQPTKNI